MTKYIELKGGTIQATDTDPALYAGAWASGGALNTARSDNGSAGTQTAALTAGGDTSPGYVNLVESYDGTSWTETTEINTSRFGFGSSGIQTSALIYGGTVSGGADPGATESWNGSAWTEVGDHNTGRYQLTGA